MIDTVFSQTGVVLFSSPPTLEQLQECFSGWNPAPLTVAESSGTGVSLESFNGPGISVQADPGRENRVDIDIQSVQWPDDLGDNSSPGPVLAAAAMGAYGAFARPGGLAKAVSQAWYWSEAGAAVEAHRAYVRIRVRGTLLREGDDAGAPAAVQLSWVVNAAARLLALPGALAWYNPAAELLLDEARFSRELSDAAAGNRPAVDALISTRIWKNPGWVLMDTAGMQQFGLPDMEFAGSVPPADPGAIIGVFRGLCLYLMERGDIIQSGNTVDGPSGPWRARRCRSSVVIPGRAVLRWAGDADPAPPPELAPVEPEPDNAPPDSEDDTGLRSMLQMVTKGFAKKWSASLPAFNQALARYRQTADFIALAGVSTSTTDPRQLPKKLAGAELIPAFPSISNSSEDMPLRPALLVGTFDPSPEAIMLCASLAERIGDLYGAPAATDPEDRLLQKIVENDRYVEGARTLLPASVTGGREIYAFGALLAEDMEDVMMNGSLTPLLTVRGQGRAPAVAIPLSVLHGEQGPPIYRRIAGEDAPPVPRPASRNPAPAPAQKSGCGRKVLIVFLILFALGGLHRLIYGPTPKNPKKDSKSIIDRFEEKLEERKRNKSTP